ncbi:hypothetical protein GGR44_000736 [Sphingobium fontiphilum]|uniref:Yip1 domain-containing protein n=1 Tax=Sphingobium fontiphilum TaxID=944425 RepID=A0A7W6DIA9_9SPHN|nr:Yip1 family protein [Sphingobium fontiphilum]MBB3981105.1 hypothetical protein [Sphingobium fontiphilum]
MTDTPPLSTTPGLVDRAKAILLKPKEEWAIIDREPASIGGIFVGYAVILAAITPVCQFIGGQIFGFGAFGFSYRPSLVGSLASAIAQYVFSLIGLFVLAFIINFLAPKFGGQQDKVKAFKVAAYAATAGWLSGVFALVPALSVLGLLGLYSLYLLYLGLPALMKAPQDKAMPYTVVTIIAAAVLFIIAGAVAAPIGKIFAPAAPGGSLQGEMTIPGVGKVDLDKLEAAGKQMEQAARDMEDATKPGAAPVAMAPAQLQALLPASIGRFQRTEIESAGMSGGSRASARYTAGDDDMQVEVVDMAAMGAIAGIGAAFQVQQSKETATGYERTQTIDGRLVNEEWDNESRHGKFATTIGNRFMVSASGTVGGIDELKAAVNAVGPDKLAAMAK